MTRQLPWRQALQSLYTISLSVHDTLPVDEWKVVTHPVWRVGSPRRAGCATLPGDMATPAAYAA